MHSELQMSTFFMSMHYQILYSQDRLVRLTQSKVFNAPVDLCRSSTNFGKWVGVELSAENKSQPWFPPGFFQGSVVTSEYAEFLHKTTNY